MLAKITMRNRKRGELIVYDSYTLSWPSRRAWWLTFRNGDDVVLHCRVSEIDDFKRLN
ncbi:hypothetical protein GCM10009530_63720 [Microbispora corallina]|uniref:Uncharacterized protein n=1 Tax=Microbispora corallina TaxID=83302 RepID=A0ABQ4GC37_9ACTN|nr:hypothetical protein [Microbispora corallina]GIH44595.1 hypothetical protein Mco01_75950 [Microbispora corallina]